MMMSSISNLSFSSFSSFGRGNLMKVTWSGWIAPGRPGGKVTVYEVEDPCARRHRSCSVDYVMHHYKINFLNQSTYTHTIYQLWQ